MLASAELMTVRDHTSTLGRRSVRVASTPRGAAVVAVLLVFSLGLGGCASVAPGHDPVVVHTEQALKAGDALYGDAMAYYFAPGVAPTLSVSVTKVFEAVRTGYDPLYKDVQASLDAYKAVKAAVAAGQAGDLALAAGRVAVAIDKLAALVNQVIAQLPATSTKKSAGRPVARLSIANPPLMAGRL